MAGMIRNSLRVNSLLAIKRLMATTNSTQSTNIQTMDDIGTDEIKITFTEENGKKAIIKTEPGKSLYDVVMENNMDYDGFGSCGATLCCTTCHLIVKPEDYDKLSPPTEEELNMLDLAEGLCDTSRLGCQVVLPKGLKSLDVQVPANLTDART